MKCEYHVYNNVRGGNDLPADSDVEEYSQPLELPASESVKKDKIEIDMVVLEHLLFHKAIGEGGINVDKYLEILRSLTEGDHVIMDDPRDRTAALVFELVIKENFNPWDIDLKRFALQYLERIKDHLDFITAGRLVFMAFRILKLQSSELLESLYLPEEDDYDDMMDIEPWMEEEESYLFTRKVVEMKNPPVEEIISHRGDRRVTLFELVNAFNDAVDESVLIREHHERMKEERRRQARLRKKTRSRVGEKVHDEDYKEDIDAVFTVLTNQEQDVIPFSRLLDDSPVDHVTTFISLLFLNFEEMIEVWQENFPYGEIFIRKNAG